MMPRQFTTFDALVAMLLAATVASSCSRPGAPAGVPVPARDTAQGAVLDEAQDRTPTPRRAPTPEPGSAVACTSSGSTAFNADSVALRFVGAFMNVRLLPIRLSLPSAGAVDAGPADVTVPTPSRISARMTTQAREDGTAYQLEVRVAPPVQGWTAAGEAAGRDHAAGLCDRLKRLALP